VNFTVETVEKLFSVRINFVEYSFFFSFNLLFESIDPFFDRARMYLVLNLH
jgi:hypothetical protein